LITSIRFFVRSGGQSRVLIRIVLPKQLLVAAIWRLK